MRYIFFLLLSTQLCTGVSAQTNPVAALPGAWEATYTEVNGRPARLMMIVSPTHMAMTAYYADDGEFIATLGGAWRGDWDHFSITYEFDSSDTAKVGSVARMPFEINGNFLIFNGNRYWNRVDDNTGGAVAGAWEITGRKVDGEMKDLSARRQGPRKTMKILSGTRFQWIAFDTETKSFSGTGGGTYTTDANGLYTEKIDFFSRDQSRVGKQLSFDYELRKGDWIHQGQSSKGQPIHEVWSKRR